MIKRQKRKQKLKTALNSGGKGLPLLTPISHRNSQVTALKASLT